MFFLSTIPTLLFADSVPITAKEECQELGGEFDSAHLECFSNNSALNEAAEKYCEKQGGAFQVCGSPCRHQPEAAVCITMCEWVCHLGQDKIGGEDRKSENSQTH